VRQFPRPLRTHIDFVFLQEPFQFFPDGIEEEFLAPFFEKAKTGGILIVSEIHRAHKKRIGKDIPLSSTYNLLHRHNWRKIAPRPSHPKGDEEKREEYKALVFPPTGDKGKD
jgi:hypothetical protein